MGTLRGELRGRSRFARRRSFAFDDAVSLKITLGPSRMRPALSSSAAPPGRMDSIFLRVHSRPTLRKLC